MPVAEEASARRGRAAVRASSCSSVRHWTPPSRQWYRLREW